LRATLEFGAAQFARLADGGGRTVQQLDISCNDAIDDGVGRFPATPGVVALGCARFFRCHRPGYALLRRFIKVCQRLIDLWSVAGQRRLFQQPFDKDAVAGAQERRRVGMVERDNDRNSYRFGDHCATCCARAWYLDAKGHMRHGDAGAQRMAPDARRGGDFTAQADIAPLFVVRGHGTHCIGDERRQQPSGVRRLVPLQTPFDQQARAVVRVIEKFAARDFTHHPDRQTKVAAKRTRHTQVWAAVQILAVRGWNIENADAAACSCWVEKSLRSLQLPVGSNIAE
jgi:hypothetical protein